MDSFDAALSRLITEWLAKGEPKDDICDALEQAKDWLEDE